MERRILGDLAPELMLLLQNQAGVVRRVFQLSDDHSLDRDVEPGKNTGDQIVSQGPLLGRLAQEHADDLTHVVLDLNDEDFLVVADKNRAAAIGGQNSADIDRHGIFLHTLSLGEEREKTSPL